MAKEAVNIADILKSLTLTSSEDRSLGISSNDLSTGIKSCRRSLIGRFFAAKEIVVKGLKLAIVKAWNCTHFSVVKLHRNTYQFVFDKEEDLHRILEGGPWSFDNYLLVLRRWKNDWDRDDSYFGECDFWIHVVGLPFYFITPSVGRRLAADFHNCSAIQIRVDSGTNQWLFRLRVTINVMQPLLRAVTLKAENDSKVTALIQYEWLPNVCYQCGHLDHTLKFCNLKTGEVPKSEFSRLPFGKWLGASRRTLLHIDVPLYENDINCPSLDISGNDIVREHKQGENSEQEVCVDSRSDLSETCSSKCLEEEEGDVVPDLDCSIKNTESITSLSQTSMDECREDNLFKAKLAQQAERYKEMVQFMKKVVSSSASSEELSLEERDLLLVAYKHVIGATRASWRIIALIEQKDKSRCNKGHLAAIRSYKTKIESELSSICEGILKLLDTRLIGSAMSGECKVLYLKMKGDHNRYLAEFKTGVERKEAAMNTLDAYKAAQDISNAELAPTHPIRLGLALNFSVFYYEILNSPDQACTIAAQAFQKAIAELGTLREAPLKDITLTLQLLCDNLTLWLSESPAGRRRQGHQGSRKT